MLYSLSRTYVCFWKMWNIGLHYVCACCRRTVIKEVVCHRISWKPPHLHVSGYEIGSEKTPVGSLTTLSWWLEERDRFFWGSGLNGNRSKSHFQVSFIGIQERAGAWVCKTKKKTKLWKFPKETAWERKSVVGRQGKKRKKEKEGK